MAKKLPPPPRPGEPGFHDWMLLFYQLVTGETAESTQAVPSSLTDGGDSDLHYHAADRDRANHTGTQPASTISNLSSLVQSLVGNHATLNGLAWTNAGHTGTASTIPGFNSSGIAEELTRTGTGTVVAMSASPTFTGTVSVAAVAGSGTYTFNNAQYIAWKNAAGTASPVLQKFSDNNLYFDNYDGDIVVRPKEGAGVLAAMTLSAESQAATFAGSVSIGGGTAITTSNQTGTGNLVLHTSPTFSTQLVLNRASVTPNIIFQIDGVSKWLLRCTSGGGMLIQDPTGVTTWLTVSATALTPTVQIQAPDGTASAPSYSFSSSGNTDNGMYLSATDTVAIAAAGALVASFSSTGVASVGAIKSSSSSGGVGYATGAGGTVTQLTSKTTAVTLDKVCGTITTNNAALADATAVLFTLNNSTIASTDIVAVAVINTSGSYEVTTGVVSAGSVRIRLKNISGGSLSDAVEIRFVVIKSVNS